ncbi:MAG: hypothetical protein ACLUS5_14810 [Roseburia faecis]
MMETQEDEAMGSYLVIIAVLIIFFCIRRRRRTAAVAWQILNRCICIFIVEDDEIIARTVKSHLETMSDELRKSTIFH